MIHSAKRSVMEQRQNSTTLLLETELYVLWLEELNYAVVALDVSSSPLRSLQYADRPSERDGRQSARDQETSPRSWTRLLPNRVQPRRRIYR